MEQATAEILFAVIVAIGSSVWLVSLVRLLKLGAGPRRHEREQFDAERFDEERVDDVAGTSESNLLTGQKTVRGTGEDVSLILAETILKSGVPGMFMSLFEVTERTSDRVSIRKTGPLICNQPSGMYFSDADFYLTPEGPSQVRISYELRFDRFLSRVRQIGLAIVLGLGLPTIVAVSLVTWFYAVQSPDPGIRFQVFQTLQICHALWPPFMLLYRYRTGRRHGRTFVSNVLASVEVATMRMADRPDGAV